MFIEPMETFLNQDVLPTKVSAPMREAIRTENELTDTAQGLQLKYCPLSPPVKLFQLHLLGGEKVLSKGQRRCGCGAAPVHDQEDARSVHPGGNLLTCPDLRRHNERMLKAGLVRFPRLRTLMLEKIFHARLTYISSYIRSIGFEGCRGC
jgi:hypothetical protein